MGERNVSLRFHSWHWASSVEVSPSKCPRGALCRGAGKSISRVSLWALMSPWASPLCAKADLTNEKSSLFLLESGERFPLQRLLLGTFFSTYVGLKNGRKA